MSSACPPVSVVIPVYNGAHTIEAAIQAVLSQTYKGSVECIVVDDGSTDTTGDIVRAFNDVVYVKQANAGPAAARNRGYRLSTGEYVCFTDADCVPESDWIEQLSGGFKERQIAVVSGSYGIFNPESALARGIHAEILYRHTKRMPDYPKSFGSYNFCVRRSVMEKVGGFDQTYRQASGEDNDLSYRILKSGHTIFFNRNAKVKHRHPEVVTRYLKEQFRHGFWRAKMYAQHPDMVKGDDYTFWKDILEMPLSCLGCLGLMLSITRGLFFFYWLLFQVVFFVFEVFFALRIGLRLNESFGYGCVMWLRSYARTVGIIIGAISFIVNNKLIEKKLKKTC